MVANLITLTRITLTFVVIGLLDINFYLDLVMFVLIVIVILLDWLDGFLARKLGEASRFGALFDIAGDRIVESTFWIYFAVKGSVSVWVPVIVIARGFLADLVRTMAFARGRTPFGGKTMMASGWARLLVSSRLSRGVYAGLKVAAFCYLAALIVVANAPKESIRSLSSGWLQLGSQMVVWVVVVMCVVRGIPVIWDGRKYLLESVR